MTKVSMLNLKFRDISLQINHSLKLLGLIVMIFICESFGSYSVWAINESVSEGLTEETTQQRNESGIQIISLNRTAADYMLDLRFKMLDPEAAVGIMNRKNKPHIIIERTGQKLYVPVSEKIGPLRQAPKFVKADRNYFIFFANPGRTVKAGDKVTIVIGDFKQEHIVVE